MKIELLAQKRFPDSIAEQRAYIDGFKEALKQQTNPPTMSFFEELATRLRDLWPSGEKDGKYSWRAPMNILVTRLEFIWKEKHLDNKYSINDCLIAARRYLSQFETNVKYMQLLKYFIFKQNKIVASNGKITYTYQSSLVDYLENNIASTEKDSWDDIEETAALEEQGELI